MDKIESHKCSSKRRGQGCGRHLMKQRVRQRALTARSRCQKRSHYLDRATCGHVIDSSRYEESLKFTGRKSQMPAWLLLRNQIQRPRAGAVGVWTLLEASSPRASGAELSQPETCCLVCGRPPTARRTNAVWKIPRSTCGFCENNFVIWKEA